MARDWPQPSQPLAKKRPWRLFLPALMLAALASSASSSCRLSLSMGLDVSGSVDSSEYVLQMTGLANALRSEEVRQLLLLDPLNPVYIHVFEWSGRFYQSTLVDWTGIDSSERLDQVTDRLLLLSGKRSLAPLSTGIGQAMAFAKSAFDSGPGCPRRILDISGDGKNNDGPRPREIHDRIGFGDITVNALVIGPDAVLLHDHHLQQIGELVTYFKSEVIHGPGSFVEAAVGYKDYEQAMIRKLIRELSFGLVSSAPRGLGPLASRVASHP